MMREKVGGFNALRRGSTRASRVHVFMWLADECIWLADESI